MPVTVVKPSEEECATVKAIESAHLDHVIEVVVIEARMGR
jgi:hypothetical protein